jgi:hypothetical protein
MDSKKEGGWKKMPFHVSETHQGYFEFPRKISLTNLGQLVGAKPSTLTKSSGVQNDTSWRTQ